MAEATITERSETHFKIEITIPYGTSMLEAEERLQERINEAGALSTGELLSRFDTDGSPLRFGDIKMTSKGQMPVFYQTPYGQTQVYRHVYQTAKGGKTFCPLEQNVCFVLGATPKFAKMLSWKFSEMGSTKVIEDLHSNHKRVIARSYLQNVCEAVATFIESKEASWEYELPKLDGKVHAIAIGLDGTCIFTCVDGYRQAMVGNISLYDKQGERLHTIYAAATPEYGKETFLTRLDRECQRMRMKYPHAIYVGLADGAKDNWEFLKSRVSMQILDFYHASEYLTKASKVLFKGSKHEAQRSIWLEESCHSLKHKRNGARRLHGEMLGLKSKRRLSVDEKAQIDAAITYFENNHVRMRYSEALEENLPIGSGVTEAACKVIVKQRMCGSGMKWKEKGASVVLTLRSLQHTFGRWDQCWQKMEKCGSISRAA